jgi:hypothetical protein
MFNVWKILSFASHQIRDVGIRCWSIDSGIYLIYSRNQKKDDEDKILFDKGWQLYYNCKKDVVERRKISRETAKTILYGLVITKTKKDNLLNE